SQNSGAPKTVDKSVWNWLTIEEVSAKVSLANIKTFTFPGNTSTIVPYTNELFDDDNEFDPGTSSFVPTHAGDYHFCLSLLAPQDASSYSCSLATGGTTGAAVKTFASGVSPVSGCRTVRLAANESASITGVQYTGNPHIANPDARFSWLTISK